MKMVILTLLSLTSLGQAAEFQEIAPERDRVIEYERERAQLLEDRRFKMRQKIVKVRGQQEELLRQIQQQNIRVGGGLRQVPESKLPPGVPGLRPSSYPLTASSLRVPAQTTPCGVENWRLNGDVKIRALGTRQGYFPGFRGRDQHPMTDVTVNLTEMDSEILLLTSYEPIRWHVRKGHVDLRGIIVSGHHQQEVRVDADTPVLIHTLRPLSSCQVPGYVGSEVEVLENLSKYFFQRVPDSVDYHHELPERVSLPFLR